MDRRDSRGVESLQYGPLLGVKDLREIIVDELLAPKGVKTDADHIMITTGGLETVPPILCEHERLLQPLCDELAATLYAERNPLFLAQHYDPAFPIRSILEDLGA